MVGEFEGNKTEAPTPRRREEARKEGQVVFSPDLTSAWTLLVGCGALLLFGQSIGLVFTEAMHLWLGRQPPREWGIEQTALAAQWLGGGLLRSCAAPVAVIAGCGLAAGFLQSSQLISFKPLSPNWEKLSPAKGWSRLMSVEAVFRGVWAALRFAGFLLTAAGFIWLQRDRIGHSGVGTPGGFLTEGWQFAMAIALVLAGSALLVGVADYLLRWFRNEARLRMSRSELKEEQKEEQGDPQVRAAIRRFQRERARKRSVKEVPQASVVITNPTHIAVALKYDLGKSSAPRVVAKGAGELAKRIKEIAYKHGIPVVERKPLARALYKAVPVGRDIPLEFYRAVAEILAQIYRERQAAA